MKDLKPEEMPIVPMIPLTDEDLLTLTNHKGDVMGSEAPKTDFLNEDATTFHARLRRLDQPAWERLYNEAQGLVVGYFIVHRYSEDDAFDIFHQTYQVVWEKAATRAGFLAGIRTNKALVAYMIGIGRKYVLWRKTYLFFSKSPDGQPSEKQLAALAEREGPNRDRTETSLDALFQREELIEEQWRRIEKVLVDYPNEKHKKIFRAHFRDLLPVTKNAARHNTSEQNVRQVVKRIKDFLKSRLN